MSRTLCCTQPARPSRKSIVPGGGVALVAPSGGRRPHKDVQSDEKIGAQIVRRSLEEPLRQIVANAGEEGAVVVAKVLAFKEPTYGYNTPTGVLEDLVKAGVIDPTKVTRTALENAPRSRSPSSPLKLWLSSFPCPRLRSRQRLQRRWTAELKTSDESTHASVCDTKHSKGLQLRLAAFCLVATSKNRRTRPRSLEMLIIIPTHTCCVHVIAVDSIVDAAYSPCL